MLATPLILPLCHPLAASLSGAFGQATLDPAAAAYIAAVETAKGSAVSPTQRAAINAFITAEKSAARWDLHKRLYLPIWGQAAANAICLRSGASGTFGGGVTHGAGFVQGDGTTGYLDFGTTALSMGLTPASGYMIALVTLASTLGFRGLVGRFQASTSVCSLMSSASGQLCRYNTTSTGQVSGSSDGLGILSASRSGGVRAIYRRKTAARTTLVSAAGADAGTIPTAGNLFGLALNNDTGGGGTLADANDARVGSLGISLGMSDADDAAFTANLKTLWETCTGLTLP